MVRHGIEYISAKSQQWLCRKNPELHICPQLSEAAGGKQFGRQDKKKNRKTASTSATNTQRSGGSGTDGAGRGGRALGGAVGGVQEATGDFRGGGRKTERNIDKA